MLSGDFRGFWREGSRGGLPAALHRPKAGWAGVRGVRRGSSPSNSVSENSLAAAQKKHAHPAGPRLGDSAGNTEGFERVGGSPSSKSGCSQPKLRVAYGVTRDFCLEKPTSLSRTSPQKGPVPRPGPPEGLPARLQRALGTLLGLQLGLSCPGWTMWPPRPSSRRTPPRHASVPLGER